MARRRANLFALCLLGFTGCEHLDSLRQGVLSTYSQELRQLATDIDRAELAKIATMDQERTRSNSSTNTSAPEVQQVQWHALPLANAVHLQAPVPASGSVAPLP
jgi:hypothetical protein